MSIRESMSKYAFNNLLKTAGLSKKEFIEILETTVHAGVFGQQRRSTCGQRLRGRYSIEIVA